MPQLWVYPEELDADSASPHAYEACKTATYILWAFSGRKYSGLKTVTERYEYPCRVSSLSGFNILPFMTGDGEVYNGIFSNRADYADICGCPGTFNGRHIRLRLHGTPVRSVQQVKRRGEVLDSSQYKIVNGTHLQLVGGTGTVLDLCDIEITYTYGVNVPMAGRRAARKLASEFVAGWSGQDCMLPDNVQNINRQGISMTIFDPQTFLNDGKVGVYEVDLFLAAANPDKARKPAKVFSPDTPKAIRTTSGPVDQVMGPYDWKIVPSEESTWTLDLVGANADILTDPSWNPTGQITAWNGASLFEFDSSRFTITNGVLTVSLTAQETASLSNMSSAAWDLYAISATDGYTLVHVLSSNIRITS